MVYNRDTNNPVLGDGRFTWGQFSLFLMRDGLEFDSVGIDEINQRVLLIKLFVLYLHRQVIVFVKQVKIVFLPLRTIFFIYPDFTAGSLVFFPKRKEKLSSSMTLTYRWDSLRISINCQELKN